MIHHFMNNMMRNQFFLGIALLFLLPSCGIEKQIQKAARHTVLEQKALKTAHVGISVFEPATGRSWYDYQGDHYFIPASNTKIPTCYAGMKYLGDSLLSAYLQDSAGVLYVQPCGDPTFLHADFSYQPLWKQLQQTNNKITIDISTRHRFSAYGSGWSWDDYDADYLAERSVMPVYGNLIHFKAEQGKLTAVPSQALRPPYMSEAMIQLLASQGKFSISRLQDENVFTITRGSTLFTKADIPFKTKNGITGIQFLQDSLQQIGKLSGVRLINHDTPATPLYSVPTDSLFRPMMHRSDNFFAEQTILMVSQRLFGYMNDKKTMDSLLQTDFGDLPQKPRWADGSGLSRYNLFSPRDFVAILQKIEKEFGMERVKLIFPTGGEGTISSYYKKDSGYIYAKTGTLSGVVGFSGYLYTKKGKLLLFSTLVNNHQASATEVRRSIEKFLERIRERY